MAFDFPMTKSTYSVIPFALMRQLVRAPFQSLVKNEAQGSSHSNRVTPPQSYEALHFGKHCHTHYHLI